MPKNQLLIFFICVGIIQMLNALKSEDFCTQTKQDPDCPADYPYVCGDNLKGKSLCAVDLSQCESMKTLVFHLKQSHVEEANTLGQSRGSEIFKKRLRNYEKLINAIQLC